MPADIDNVLAKLEKIAQDPGQALSKDDVTQIRNNITYMTELLDKRMFKSTIHNAMILGESFGLLLSAEKEWKYLQPVEKCITELRSVISDYIGSGISESYHKHLT